MAAAVVLLTALAVGAKNCSQTPNRRVRVLSPRTDALTVLELGEGPQIRIHCIGFAETPASVSTECSSASVPILCATGPWSHCMRLSEYMYRSDTVTTWGRVSDSSVHWILQWDPNAKPSACYPLNLDVSITYELRSAAGGNLTLAIIAIVIVVVLVVVVVAFVVAQLVDRVRGLRQKKAGEERE
eukprot:Hpha_TRINITY_DN33774_c0_g1::TRINITY_DN33774_c0_g1_i1::g.25125::m.25125